MTGIGRQAATTMMNHVGRLAGTLALVAIFAALTASAQTAQPNPPQAAPATAASPVDRAASGD